MKQSIENIQKAGVNLTTNKGEFTRPSAAIIAATELSNQGENVNAHSIDDFVFSNFYFTIAGNKTQGKSKNSGDGRLYKRLDTYLNKNPQLFTYDRFADKLVFTDLGKSKLLKAKRQRVSFAKVKTLTQNIEFKTRKTILTKSDKKKISDMFAMHVTV